jgi:hypothetical protein
MIEIKFLFYTLEEAYDFILKQKQEPLQHQIKIKKENDGRGRSTKQFHEKCKIYHANHPDLSYRECLKLVSKECK